MELYLAATMERLRVEPTYFFRLAHQWRFSRDVDTTGDAIEYLTRGTIPPYVRDYVRHLQQGENRAMPKV